MRQAKVIYCRKPKKRRVYKRKSLLPFFVLILLRLGLILTPIIYVGLYIFEHGTPHILWEYQYYGSSENPQYVSCTYWGIYEAKIVSINACPIFLFTKT